MKDDTPNQPPPVLTIGDLAKRWGIGDKTAARRVNESGLPRFNVGTALAPVWRYRLETVEAWERQNERTEPGQGANENRPKPRRFRAWGGEDFLKLDESKGKRRKA
jgi:hypothetical protein